MSHFAEEFARRKAENQRKKDGVPEVEEHTSEPEVSYEPQQSKPVVTNKGILVLLGLSMLLNILSVTLLEDWFDFMGSSEYAVWKVRHVKGATIKDYAKHEKIYEDNLKRMVKNVK